MSDQPEREGLRLHQPRETPEGLQPQMGSEVMENFAAQLRQAIAKNEDLKTEIHALELRVNERNEAEIALKRENKDLKDKIHGLQMQIGRMKAKIEKSE